MSATRTAVPPPERTFSATELEAAANLVLLSESSSVGEGEEAYLHEAGRGSCCSSSSAPSVNTKAIVGGPKVEEEEEAIDEENTAPWARRRRYRSISDLYAVTVRIDEKKRRKRRN